MNTPRSLLALALTATLALSACGDDSSEADSEAPAVSPTINVGHTADPLSELLAEIYGRGLESAGFRIGYKDAAADRQATLDGLTAGSLQLVPETSSELLDLLGAEPVQATPTTGAPTDTGADTTVPAGVLPDASVAAMNDALPDALTVNGAAAATATPTVACSPAAVGEHSLTDISSLAAAAADVSLGVPSSFDLGSLKSAYGATFTTSTVEPDGVADAVAGGTDCVVVPAWSPAIATVGLLPLDDDKAAIPVDAIAPVVAVEVSTPDLIAALSRINAALTTDVVRALLVKADNGEPYATLAKQFVSTLSGGQ